MIEVHLITLNGHKPSIDVKKVVHFWLDDIVRVKLSETNIVTRQDLLRSKREFKFHTLPCIIVNDTLTKGKAERFYYDKIKDKLQEIKSRHPSEKRRRLGGARMRRKIERIG